MDFCGPMDDDARMILLVIGIVAAILVGIGYPLALCGWLFRVKLDNALAWAATQKPCPSCGRMIPVNGPAWCSAPCADGSDEAPTIESLV